MKNIYILAIVLILGACTQNKTTCTDQPKEQWQDQEVFKENLVSQGFKIKEFKVTEGKCYEMYGWNKEGQKVEIYFNPVDAAIVKEEVH